MSNYNPNDDRSEQANSGINNAGERIASTGKREAGKVAGQAGRAMGRVAKRTAIKAGKKVASKLATKGVLALVKGLVSGLAAVLAPVIPFMVIAIVATATVASIFTAWRTTFFNDPAMSGAFQIDSINQDNLVIRDGTTIEEIQTSLGNDVAGLFYTKFANKGFFYRVDGDPTIRRGGLNSTVRDFEGRESIFLLNPQMLMALDRGLNDGFMMPERFLKPVFNSCMVDDPSLRTIDGPCRLLNLFEEGELVPQGYVYERRFFGVNDTKPEGVDPSFSGFLDERTDKRGGSIMDWGLAPIFHYKTFKEESRVTNYAIFEAQRFNPETRRVETVKFAHLSDSERSKFPSVPESFAAGHREDRNNQLPASTEKHALLSVVSFLGTIQNNVRQEWVPQGAFRQVDHIRQTINLISKDSELLDANILKSICTETECVEARVIERISEEYSTYVIVQGDERRMVQAIAPVVSIFNVQLAYTKMGTIELNTLVSASDDVDTSGIVGIRYLQEFIEAYQAIIPETSRSQSFACLTTKELSLTTDWNRTHSNQSLLRPDTIRVASNFKNLPVERIVANPGSCPNNTTAVSMNAGVMESFFFDEMPNLHYQAIAKILGFNTYLDEDNQLLVESNLSTMSGVHRPAMTTHRRLLERMRESFGEEVVKYSRQFGIDEHLVFAILMATHQEEVTDNPCLVGEPCGVMQVVTGRPNEDTFEVFNRKTNTKETISIDVSRLQSEDNYNIFVGVARLQSLIKRFSGNVLLALQAYNTSIETTELLMRETGMVASSFRDIGWTALRARTKEGDPEFLEKVLSNMMVDSVVTLIDARVSRFDISFVYAIRGESPAAAINNLNNNILQKYFKDSDIPLKEVWDFLFLGQKPYDILDRPALTRGFIIDTRSMSVLDKDDIIKSVFSFAEGVPIEEFDDIDEDHWVTRVENLFMNSGPEAITVHYVLPRFVGGELSRIVPQNTFMVTSRPFGKRTDALGRTEVNSDIEIQTIPNTQVQSMTDGTVIQLVRGTNGAFSSVTVAGTPITREENGVVVVVYQTRFYYTNLVDVPENIEVGMQVKNGAVIGRASTHREGRFNLAYEVNGSVVDPQLVIEFISFALDNAIIVTGSNLAFSNREWLSLLRVNDFSAIDFNSSPIWVNPVPGGRKTAGTWVYSFGFHNGVDIGAPVGTPILASGDGVILDFRDSTRDYIVPGRHNFYTPTPINHLLYVTEKEGVVYTVWLAHIQQGSALKVSNTFKEGDIIARVGDNGRSTGPHLHMEVVNHGSQVSVQDVINRYLANPGQFRFGLNPARFPHQRCENTRLQPCGVAIDNWIFR